jgi:hypothetical protein
MTTPEVTLRPWTIMDHIEEQVADGHPVSFVLGEIAGAILATGHDPSIIRVGDSILHFTAGLKSITWKLDHVLTPRAAWHPMHTN